MKYDFLKNMWQESLGYLEKSEREKIVLATLNNMRRSYKLVLTSLPASIFLFPLFVSNFLHLPQAFSYEAFSFSWATVQYSCTILSSTVLIHIFLSRYYYAASVSLGRKDNSFMLNDHWSFLGWSMGIIISSTATFFYKPFLLPLMLLLFFVGHISIFFFLDRISSKAAFFLSIKNSLSLTLYFLPAIALFCLGVMLFTTLIIIVLYLFSLSIMAIGIPFFLCSAPCAPIMTIIMLATFYFITLPSMISLASIFHTKVKYTHFSLFYDEQS